MGKGRQPKLLIGIFRQARGLTDEVIDGAAEQRGQAVGDRRKSRLIRRRP
ncbi:hypothetical protein DSM21852_22550 [Methylocystis bryophila]|nr:hypothetical protein DSM21852_22550 [Methylocystis bryophila]